MTHQDVVDIMNEARAKDEEIARENPAEARAIIDENGKHIYMMVELVANLIIKFQLGLCI